jgi:dTDP-4-amino-4,6-dideoxygalactose transaminase
MRFRRVPPVYSPISARALWRGLRAAMCRAEADRARAELDRWVRETWGPAAWLWTDSGTSALMLALRLAMAAGRRRVALPAYGCYDLATACDGADVEVALYDVDPGTLGPDWASLEDVLAGGADILVVAYLYGIPVDVDRVRALATRFGAVFVEDAAQGIGASWAGRPLGSFGDLSVLSFGRGKGLTAGGGGLVIGRGEWAECLRCHPALPRGGRGWGGLFKSLVQWAFSNPSMYWIPAGVPFLGLGETVYRPWTEPQGLRGSAAGLLSLNRLGVEAEAGHRRKVAGRVLEAISGAPDGAACTVPIETSGVPGYLRYPVLAVRAHRGLLLSGGGAKLGLSPGYPSSLARLSGFAERCNASVAGLPGAERLASDLLTYPVHSRVEAEDLKALQGQFSQRVWPQPAGRGET